MKASGVPARGQFYGDYCTTLERDRSPQRTQRNRHVGTASCDSQGKAASANVLMFGSGGGTNSSCLTRNADGTRTICEGRPG